ARGGGETKSDARLVAGRAVHGAGRRRRAGPNAATRRQQSGPPGHDPRGIPMRSPYLLTLTSVLVALLWLTRDFAAAIDRPPPARAAAARKAEPPAEDWSGYYLCTGDLPDGPDGRSRSYEGTVQLTRLAETSYLVVWSVGTTQSLGVGLVRGRTLSAGWRTQGAEARGVTVLERDGRGFSGVWLALPGDGVPRREVWTPLKRAE